MDDCFGYWHVLVFSKKATKETHTRRASSFFFLSLCCAFTLHSILVINLSDKSWLDKLHCLICKLINNKLAEFGQSELWLRVWRPIRLKWSEMEEVENEPFKLMCGILMPVQFSDSFGRTSEHIIKRFN